MDEIQKLVCMRIDLEVAAIGATCLAGERNLLALDDASYEPVDLCVKLVEETNQTPIVFAAAQSVGGLRKKVVEGFPWVHGSGA